ncbi:AraC family transcriptional regulator N-terminal domain-containing protein [Trinickia sp. YCB016]
MEASPTKPFLGVVIEFDLAVMREVMEALIAPPRSGIDTLKRSATAWRL